jgi:hypothetical protein
LGLSNEGDATTVAWAHTHGAYDPKYASDEFSPQDLGYSNLQDEDAYVSTPSGELLKYDYTTKETSTIATDIPSDHSDPARVNSIDYKSLPRINRLLVFGESGI